MSFVSPQIAWERVREGRLKRFGTPYEVLEGTFRCAVALLSRLPPPCLLILPSAKERRQQHGLQALAA